MDQQPVPPPMFDTGPSAPLPKKKTNVWLIVGIVSAVACCPVILILAAILFPVFAMAKEAAIQEACKQNLATVGEAFEQYAQKHGGKYPAAEKWEEAIGPYLGGQTLETLRCPKVESGHGYGYTHYGGDEPSVKSGELPLLQDSEVAVFDDAHSPLPRHMRNRSWCAYYIGKGAVIEREED